MKYCRVIEQSLLTDVLNRRRINRKVVECIGTYLGCGLYHETMLVKNCLHKYFLKSVMLRECSEIGGEAG